MASYSQYELSEIEIISKRLNLVYFSFDNELIDEESLLVLINKDPIVRAAQLNHFYEQEIIEVYEEDNMENDIGSSNRNIPPNDPLFYRQ